MARQREFNKDEVIERAMLLFWVQGYEMTSIRDLKETMGISSSSMYEVFGDKRGVFLLALARFCELERGRIAQMAQDTPTPQAFIEQLFTTIETVTQPPSDTPEMTIHGSLTFNTMVEFGTRDADVTRLLLTHYFGISEIVAEVVERGQTAAMIASREAPLDLAHTILTAIHGAATVKGVKPDFAYVDTIRRLIVKLLDV